MNITQKMTLPREVFEREKSQFLVKEGEFCGRDSVLINPQHIGTKWTQDNSIFRSSVWDKNTKELLSAGFKRFVNLGENPDNFPPPNSLEGANVVEKLDGSCCIIDWINNQMSVRTRGTFSAFTLDNGADFHKVVEKYNLEKLARAFPHYTWLFELVTPNLQIVLNYPEVDAYLIGAVNKKDYSLMSQDTLDAMALTWGLKRPRYYHFDSLQELLENVKNWEKLEGCCIYTNGDQTIHKVKCEWYLRLHRLKSSLSSFDRLFDAFVVDLTENPEVFKQVLTDQIDYEVAVKWSDEIEQLCAAYSKALKRVDKIKKLLVEVETWTRKDQALRLQEALNGPEVSLAFAFLDERYEIEPKQWKRLIQLHLATPN